MGYVTNVGLSHLFYEARRGLFYFYRPGETHEAHITHELWVIGTRSDAEQTHETHDGLIQARGGAARYSGGGTDA